MSKQLRVPDMALLIDSHCHLDFPDFAEERDAIIQRARQAGARRPWSQHEQGDGRAREQREHERATRRPLPGISSFAHTASLSRSETCASLRGGEVVAACRNVRDGA